MAKVHIERAHGLGLDAARRLAQRWTEVARAKLEMECAYAQGEAGDVVRFKRSGAAGELRVDGERFVLDAKLGLLLSPFKGRIEQEIAGNLDRLLAEGDPLQAFDAALARRAEAKKDKEKEEDKQKKGRA
ncbi:polyhydroxyalkanoic acid system family protein [Ramlibacter sp.]|uniref:polyhydroxyalkanoic acid system family protein n=1 Tax=Ramlibacter sp. TaxID=1917967 RepID=UPI001844E1C4|nr:polyhydroxyalkanoic acid system family protein [Ramlibacter sp.]MBA2674635.1 polyhydroxyalkanoic acid system family protein [Ramlibacter sp.]